MMKEKMKETMKETMKEIELRKKCRLPFLYDYLDIFLHKELEGVCGTMLGLVDKIICPFDIVHTCSSA